MRAVIVVALLGALSLLVGGSVAAEVVVLYAGPGAVGSYPLNEAASLDVSPDGDLYILGADSYNVIRIRPTGLVSQIANASDGLFVPSRLALAPSGDVYVTNGAVVFRVAAAGGVTAVDFGGVVLGTAFDAAIDSADNLYVASTSATYFLGAVYKRTPTGDVSVVLGTNGAGGAALQYAADVVTAPNGDIYVAGRDSNNVFRIAAAGGAITEIIDVTGDGAGNTLANPRALSVDAGGNLYVLGHVSRNAFKITPGGVITEIIDQTGDGAGNTLDDGYGIAVGPTGNVYVAGRDKAFRITPGGVITQIIDSAGNGMGGAFVNPISPESIAVDSADNVYISGYSNHIVVRITPGGAISVALDFTGDGLGNGMGNPGGLAIDSADNVYVGGDFYDNVFKITPGGVVTQVMDATGAGGSDTLESPSSLVVDGAGNLLVYDLASPPQVFEVTSGGSISVRFDSAVAGLDLSEFGGGRAIAVNAVGAPLVAGSFTHNVLEVGPGGSATEIIDETGDGTGDPVSYPTRLALDDADNLYVSAHGSHNAFRITPAGAITKLIDAGGDLSGNVLLQPRGIDVDASGNVYVAGEGTTNVFRIEPGGTITEILDATGDGLGHTMANPSEVAVDAAGNAYVTAFGTENVFHIAPDNSVRQIIDASGDGEGNTLISVSDVATDGRSVYVSGFSSNNVFRIGPAILPALSHASSVVVVLAVLAVGWWTAAVRVEIGSSDCILDRRPSRERTPTPSGPPRL